MAIYELLAARSAQDPEAIAIVAPGRPPLSYARLCAQAEYVVTTLNSLGIGRNDRIAAVLADGPEAVVALVTVACGAVCAPLDPRSPPAEFERRLSELDATAVIVAVGSGSPIVDVAKSRGLVLLELAPELEREAGLFTLSGPRLSRGHLGGFAGPDDLALVLHTSGTTARSKLVPLTRSNVCAAAQRVQAALELSSRDRYFNVTPLFYSQGLMLSLSSLVAGGSVASAPGFNVPRFFDWLDELRPSWYSAAPAVHQAILAHSRVERAAAGPHRLRFIRSAAAPLAVHIREELERLFSAPVIDAYGMAECYPISSSPLPPRTRKPGSVGVAAGTEIGVMNEAGVLLPQGATGEIIVRGPHVMRGYLNESSRSEERFPPGWFRTGDQGYLDADGYLFLSGRIKEIINRGGEKVSPVEVDQVLLSHPDVEDAATFPVPHPTMGEDVAAAVVPREAGSVTEGQIREFAGTRLAPFKVPRHVIFVDQLPRSTAGKVQRGELAAALGLTAADHVSPAAAVHVEASNRLQQKLVMIWIQLLGISVIGIHDDFFNLGGNSLLATELIGEIDRVFGKFLPLTALLQAPTIEELATVISRNTLPGTWSALAPIQPRGSKPPFFWVHGDSSTAFLSKYLGQDQPLYGLEHQSQDGRPARYTTVGAIASHYLDEVRRVQPTGPYFLGGFSFGGTVAFEMAQQLRKAGQSADLLVMLDSHYPGEHAAAAESADTMALGADVRRHLERVSALDLRGQLAYVTSRLKSRADEQVSRAIRLFKMLSCEAFLRTGRPFPAWLLGDYLRRLYLKARDQYEPQPYSGRVIYVKSQGRSAHHRTSWGRVIGNQLEWIEIPGDHLDIVVLPYARPWVEQLQGWLDAAQRRSG